MIVVTEPQLPLLQSVALSGGHSRPLTAFSLNTRESR